MQLDLTCFYSVIDLLPYTYAHANLTSRLFIDVNLVFLGGPKQQAFLTSVPKCQQRHLRCLMNAK